MEEELLVREKKSERWGIVLQEMKVVGCFAGPMVSVGLSLFILQNLSLVMVGHLGELYLSSTALATSFAGVTGFSLLVCSTISDPPFSCFLFFFPLMLCILFTPCW